MAMKNELKICQMWEIYVDRVGHVSARVGVLLFVSFIRLLWASANGCQLDRKQVTSVLA